MFSWGDKVPSYLLGKFELMSTVTFTALFSIVFLLLSLPFSHNVWFELAQSEAFGFTMLFFLIALVIVILSKKLLYDYGRNHNGSLTYMQYVLWNLLEIVAICLLYSFFTVEGDKLGILDVKDETFDRFFFSALLYCFVSLAIPYLICAMYFAINDKDNTIRLMNYGNVVSDEVLPARDEKKITLFDNNGVLKLSVSSSNLYYIESDDNYVKVWYTDSHGVLKAYMLRCRLKTIEDSFADSSLLRCNRKYIVNMDKVSTLRREKDSYELDLDNESIPPIPVTKTYEETVLTCFNSLGN